MAGAAQKLLSIMAGRGVMGADRVVGAKLATFEGAAQVAADVASGHDQAAERSFGVRRAGVDKQTVGTGSGEDAFAERRSGIATLEGNGGQEEVGERMEHEIRQAWELARAALMFGFPAGEALGKLAAALGDGGLLEPSGNALGVELEEDAFAAIFDSGQPGTVEGEGCAFYIEGKIALNIRAGGFKPGETNLGDDLSETMHEDNAFDGRHPGGIPLGFGQRAGEEVAIGNIGAQFVLGLGEGFKFDFLNWPLGGAAALPEAGYGGENGGVLDALQLDCEGRDLPDEGEFLG